MKPIKAFLGFAALTVMLALVWLGRAGPVQAHLPTLLHAARHPRSLALSSGVLVGTPRTVRLESDLLAELNARRADNLVDPLAQDADLVAVARDRSADMVARSYFAHVNPDGQDVYMLLDARQIRAPRAGENLARNNWEDQQSAAHASAGFMASQPHRMNVLNAMFTRVGIGVAIGPEGMKVYTVLFAGD